MWERCPLLGWLGRGMHTHTHMYTQSTSIGTTPNSQLPLGQAQVPPSPEQESGRCPVTFLALCFLCSVPLTWQDRFPWQQVTKPAGRESSWSWLSSLAF